MTSRRAPFVLLIATLSVAAAARRASAAIPRTIDVQGRLSDASGTPVLHPDLLMAFRLFQTPEGGGACHEEQKRLHVVNGSFHAQVGAATPISSSCNFGAAVYLEIQVQNRDGVWDSPMSPRIPLAAAGYALAAQRLFVQTLGDITDADDDTSFPVGNNPSNVPVNNGLLSRGLNAELLEGQRIDQILNRPLYECPKGTGRLMTTPTCTYDNVGNAVCDSTCEGGTVDWCPAGCTTATGRDGYWITWCENTGLTQWPNIPGTCPVGYHRYVRRCACSEAENYGFVR